ncbi:uncharacterized protein LOC129919570 isoform X1 [Episyrphus balteatus]|uniref:uncharacterized protein LOC129919570 isoform X1 n=1 Tax=Episyrphus balteatus TaxID=286459 RepID=UPI002485624F|nr:uncharacterized protein LOC129919570 isoform X1 [Episyrphus balteatus]
MTSGEWDLRALKALEEEEQAQFRAISESNLFKTPLPPPPPPVSGAALPVNASLSSSTSNQQQPSSQPQIILPTINEHCGDLDGDGLLDVPPLPLTLFRSSDVAASTLSLGRKKKKPSSTSSIPTQPFLLSSALSSGSAKPSTGTFSPPQFTASPIFTPPPIRRCATLSHSGGGGPAVRRHFRSLHHQILGKKSAASGGGGANGGGGLERRRSRSNYNCNYTSCTGGGGGSSPSGTLGGGLGLSGSLSDNNDYDSTDSGSCTVPLTKDSIEMMRLMLFSATSSKSNSPEIPPSIASASSSLSATGGNGGVGGVGLGGTRPLKISSLIHDDSCMDDDILTNGNCNSSVGVTRRHHHQQQQQKQKQQQHRHKSFLSFTGCDSFVGGIGRGGAGDGRSGGSSSNSSATGGGGGGSIMGITCTIRKSPTKSLLMSGCAIELDASALNPTRTSDQDSDIMDPSSSTLLAAASSSSKGQLQQLLLDEDSSSSGIRTTNHFNDLVKSIQSTKSTGIATATDGVGPPPSSQQHQHQHPCSGMFDHELEHHIKHCSCSCNHMGYGNSMDYQTTGFGGLPDVTEHSNIRRSISRQNSISNSDSIEISSIQKTKGLTIKPNTSRQSKNQNDTQQHASSKRNFCIYTLSLMAALALSLVAAMLAYQHFLMAPSRNSHEQRLRIVRRILRDVPLVDGHNDFAWNVRKYAHSSLELVELSHDMDHKSMWNRPAWSQTDITRLRQGLVGVQAWSAYVPCEAQGLDAVQLALEQIDIIHRLTDMYPKDTALVTSYQEILTVRRQGLMASMIGIEGGHAIGSSLGVLRSYHSLGARYLSLTHKCDIPWAGSSASAFEMGLSTFGKAVVKEMNRLGMMIDLSQSSDETARDVFQVTRAPVIFSHSAARQLCNSTRNIPDDVLRMVADNGGLIMISFDSEVVSCGRTSTLLDVVAHIKYIRMIAGIQHIGIGAGYDGIEQPPVGLENVSKYPDLLATLLEDPNWSEEDIAMLAGKNFLRVLKSVENVRDYWKRAAIPPGEVSEQLPKTHCTYMSS